MRSTFCVFILLLLGTSPGAVSSASGDAPEACERASAMDNVRLGGLIEKISDKVEGGQGYWRFLVADRLVLVITDEKANRMRIMSGVVELAEIDNERLQRLMQANFDSALDARYAVAKGVLWSAFLHPLSTLEDDDFVSGVAQVVNLAITYGSTYSSGVLTFGGGDSRGLIQELRERANAI